MNKYVIELRPDCKVVQQICESNGQVCIGTRSIRYLEELNSDYINEHFGSLQDDAYQRGLEDAWEAARKIVKMPDPPYWGVFDEYKDDLFRKITATEAIAKLKAYEEKQKHDDKIVVGDEVEWDNDFTGDRFIVTRIYQPYGKKEQCDGIDDDGDVYRAVLIESLVKTGRHFDIASILKEMQS